MALPRRILVPFDFSAAAKGAFRYATDLAKALPRSEIILMHAIEPMIPIGAGFVQGLGAAGNQSWREKVGRELEKMSHRAKSNRQAPVRTVVRLGRAFHEIVQVAKEVRADLIVMGSIGYNSLHMSVFGSTAERVARAAPCPLLLVGGKGKARR